ncbi:hypothetical protein [Halorussus lipolyticus]|uniref:DUF7837 family putative zinc-binding protein n=1 Tax=Halorussus lipolyticus TaxID=3034024 RepID=UPI0023E76988|nr:hypothetical protein [Halorussus sp. DT80]
MSPASTLGRCPNCGEAITRDCVLIEYESKGRPAAFAECPDCRDVVHPSGE